MWHDLYVKWDHPGFGKLLCTGILHKLVTLLVLTLHFIILVGLSKVLNVIRTLHFVCDLRSFVFIAIKKML